MKHSKNRILLRIATVFFAAVFVFSAVMLYREYAEKKRSVEAFGSAAALVKTRSDLNGESEDAENNASASEKADAQEEAEPAGPSAYDTYAAVYEQNNDFVGWISIDGTVIDYPVMQTPDDPEYYLERGFDRTYNGYGVPFVQSNCDIDHSDNLVIYAHHMKDGSMFAGLCDYTDEEFYKEHKTIRFDTLSEFGEYEIVAVFKTVVYSEEGFKYYEFVDGDEAKFDAYIAKCRELELYDTGVTAEYGDRLITLSTCEYSRSNGRMVVVAKRIVSEESDTLSLENSR